MDWAFLAYNRTSEDLQGLLNRYIRDDDSPEHTATNVKRLIVSSPTLEDAGEDAMADVSFKLSVLRTILQWNVPWRRVQIEDADFESFVGWLVAITTNLTLTTSIRGAAVQVVSFIFEVFPSYQRFFAPFEASFKANFLSLVETLRTLSPPESEASISRDAEIVLHQCTSFLKKIQDKKDLFEWAASLCENIGPAVEIALLVVAGEKKAIRAQIVVDSLKCLGCLSDLCIFFNNTKNGALRHGINTIPNTLVSIPTSIIDYIGHTHIFHDSFVETFQSSLELLLHHSPIGTSPIDIDSLVRSVLDHISFREALTVSLFEVKRSETCVSLLSAIFQAYSKSTRRLTLLNHSLLNSTFEAIVILQESMKAAMKDAIIAKGTEASTKKRRSAATAEFAKDLRTSYADLRTACVSLTESALRASPSWIISSDANIALFWRLSLRAFATPSLLPVAYEVVVASACPSPPPPSSYSSSFSSRVIPDDPLTSLSEPPLVGERIGEVLAVSASCDTEKTTRPTETNTHDDEDRKVAFISSIVSHLATGVSNLHRYSEVAGKSVLEAIRKLGALGCTELLTYRHHNRSSIDSGVDSGNEDGEDDLPSLLLQSFSCLPKKTEVTSNPKSRTRTNGDAGGRSRESGGGSRVEWACDVALTVRMIIELAQRHAKTHAAYLTTGFLNGVVATMCNHIKTLYTALKVTVSPKGLGAVGVRCSFTAAVEKATELFHTESVEDFTTLLQLCMSLLVLVFEHATEIDFIASSSASSHPVNDTPIHGSVNWRVSQPGMIDTLMLACRSVKDAMVSPKSLRFDEDKARLFCEIDFIAAGSVYIVDSVFDSSKGIGSVSNSSSTEAGGDDTIANDTRTGTAANTTAGRESLLCFLQCVRILSSLVVMFPMPPNFPATQEITISSRAASSIAMGTPTLHTFKISQKSEGDIEVDEEARSWRLEVSAECMESLIAMTRSRYFHEGNTDKSTGENLMSLMRFFDGGFSYPSMPRENNDDNVEGFGNSISLTNWQARLVKGFKSALRL